MITVEIIEDAPVLLPNDTHKNFTQTKNSLPKGTIAIGEFRTVKGYRRGEPFEYKIFVTTNNEIIYQKKTKPMGATQVYLSADSQTTPTTVSIPSATNLFTTTTIVGAIGGAIAGNYFARTQGGNKNTFMIIGALAGFIVARMYQAQRSIRVKPSK